MELKIIGTQSLRRTDHFWFLAEFNWDDYYPELSQLQIVSKIEVIGDVETNLELSIE